MGYHKYNCKVGRTVCEKSRDRDPAGPTNADSDRQGTCTCTIIMVGHWAEPRDDKKDKCLRSLEREEDKLKFSPQPYDRNSVHT